MPLVPLAALLDRWRASRVPALSEQLHLIGDRLPVEVPKLDVRKKGEAAREWLQAVKSEPPHLLSARLVQLEGLARWLPAPMFWPLIEALSKLDADPRIATFATRVLVNDLRIPLTMKLARRLLDCVETHGDDTHYRSLELGLSLNPLGDQLAGRAVRLLQRGLQQHPKGPSLTPEDRKQLAATTWELPSAPAPAASMLEAIWADPRDRARRQVFADQLLEQGDPRGEFISLQLSRSLPKRQQQLLKAHGEEWLGGLVDVVDLKHHRPVFEDGFVAVVTVRAVKQAQFLLAADAKEWATVRRVRAGLQRFSKAMVGLEDVGAIKLEAVRQLGREKLPIALRSLELSSKPAAAIEPLRELAAKPRWLSLVFDVWEPTRWIRDELPRVGELEGLERLRLAARGREVLPQVLGEMGLDWVPASVTQLQLRDGDRFVILRRDRSAWSLELVDVERPLPKPYHWKEILFGFAWLTPTRVTLRVSANIDGDDVKDIEHSARRFKLPVATAELDDVPEELAW